MSGRPNYLMQKIPITRQRIRITYPQIQLTSQSQQWGYCYNLVTGCKHAGILETNRPTIDNNGSSRLYIIEAVCDRSLKKEFAVAVWNMNSSQAVRQGRYSAVVCASLGQMKNQKRLLVRVM
jgi:hypothetical protein